MKSKKNVLLSLSVFIAVVFVLTLFGQQPERGALWDTISAIGSTVKAHVLSIAKLETDVADLKANEADIITRLNALEGQNHTHDYSELTGDLPSHLHDYSDISNPPSIPTESEIIGLINEHALGAPDYDSGWQPIDQGYTVILKHYLGGDQRDYLVDLQFWHNQVGYHNWGYGRDFWYDDGFSFTGSIWHGLTNQSIRVHRYDEDTYVEKIRVRIWKYNR